ncbi:MAG: hypothetical protein AAAFM81_09595, partial [Pseudomonadota bacterium]
IGLQVANWNESRQERISESQYLQRAASEIELTTDHIERERKFAESSLEIIQTFAMALMRDDVADEVLIDATSAYLSEGAFFANFRPSRTTFDDLVSTGNLDIIEDDLIRAGLTELHTLYSDTSDVRNSNISWIQQGEDRIYYEFDAFRFDQRTARLFEDISTEALASEIRKHRSVLRRHAAFHFWLKMRSLEVYDQVDAKAQDVLALINAELSH